MVWGFGGSKKKKANAEKGPAKTTAAANATKDIRSDGQSKTPNIESRVLQKIEFPQIFGKSEVRVLEKRFHALCKPSTNYITVGDFLFQFELNGIPLMKRFVEVVLSLNGKGHAYDFQVAEIIINKVHYNKKQHDINGFVLKKAESSQNTEASFLVDSVDYGFTDVHIPDAGQTPSAGDRLYSWCSEKDSKTVHFAADFADKKIDYVMQHISRIRTPIRLIYHRVAERNLRRRTEWPDESKMTPQEKIDLKGFRDAEKARNSKGSKSGEEDSWDNKDYLYDFKIGKGKLGIQVAKTKGSETGCVVAAIQAGSQAATLGIKRGDFLVSLDNKKNLLYLTKDQVNQVLGKAAKPFTLKILRMSKGMYSVEFESARGSLGLAFIDQDENNGVRVKALQGGSQAETSGVIKKGDYIAYVGKSDVIAEDKATIVKLIKESMKSEGKVRIFFYCPPQAEKVGDNEMTDVMAQQLKTSQAYDFATKRNVLRLDDFLNVFQVLDGRFDANLKQKILFAVYDVDGDGQIGLEDLVHVLTSIYRASCPGRYGQTQIRDMAFETLRTANASTGYIDQHTFVSNFGNALNTLFTIPPHIFTYR